MGTTNRKMRSLCIKCRRVETHSSNSFSPSKMVRVLDVASLLLFSHVVLVAAHGNTPRMPSARVCSAGLCKSYDILNSTTSPTHFMHSYVHRPNVLP